VVLQHLEIMVVVLGLGDGLSLVLVGIMQKQFPAVFDLWHFEDALLVLQVSGVDSTQLLGFALLAVQSIPH
jgi:hypothetical protein